PNWSSFLNALDPFGGTSAPDVASMLVWFRGYNVDTEPDIFYYDVNGLSGKFVFGLGNINTPLSQRVAMIPYRDISIQPTLATTTQSLPGNLTQFLITDEKGNRFFFNVVEESNVTDQGNGFA